MVTFEQWLEATDYRITDSEKYGWDCYGDDARIMSYDAPNDEFSQAASVEIIFSADGSKTVFEVGVYDYLHNKAYRLINPEYIGKYHDEVTRRIADGKLDNDRAWDDVSYIDLETAEDFLEKLTAILSGEPYDDRVSIPLDLPSDSVFTLMKMAHEQDITFNQLISNILVDYIHENEPDDWTD
jgi:hypothetical protein